MIWDDILPTRDGDSIGKGNERVMSQKAGNASIPRTVIQTNPDGTETMLKTGAGFSRFTTTKRLQNPIGDYWPLTERLYQERVFFAERSTLPVTGEPCITHTPLSRITMLDKNFRMVVLELKEPG